MKEIIYLDTGVIHSYIAQQFDGLPTETSNERGEEINDTNEKEYGYKSGTSLETKIKSGKFEIPVLLKTPEGELKLTLQPGRFSSEKAVISQTETGKEIISKQLHDNALETFIKNNEFYSTEDPNIEGKFVKCVSEFKIIDFKYLKNILQSDKLLEFMFIEQEEEMKKMKNDVDQDNGKHKTILREALNHYRSELSNSKKIMKSQLDFIEKAISYLNDILPTESFMIMRDAIAPLKKEYLRETAKELMFKYGASSSSIHVTIVGKVTNKIKSVKIPDLTKDPFFEFPNIINAVLHPLGVINEGNLIISPIAIYFE
ncbi:hypothetical protein NSR00_17945 [Aeribacillus sp. FSL K6-8394]|uniref:DUF6414 family protein n=1 Tax=Aeribacillus sp. FSL K6-8394 TaxID=2954570 RepID=UPI0030FC07C2